MHRRTSIATTWTSSTRYSPEKLVKPEESDREKFDFKNLTRTRQYAVVRRKVLARKFV